MLKLEGFEPPTFGSGIRRATNCAIASHVAAYAHLAQKVERWPFKPMVVGSIPTVGDTSTVHCCNGPMV